MPTGKDTALAFNSTRAIQLRELMRAGKKEEFQNKIGELTAPDLAHLLVSSPQDERAQLWELIDDEHQSLVIPYVDGEIIPLMLSDKPAEYIAQVLEKVPFLHAVRDILRRLEPVLTLEVLESMDTALRRRVSSLLLYPEDTVGGLMEVDIVSVHSGVPLEETVRHLRQLSTLPPMTENIFVVDQDNVFEGTLPVGTMLVSEPSLNVRDVMISETIAVPADTSTHDAAAMFKRYNLTSVPVVDENNKLLGKITINDLLSVIIHEADHSMMRMAGLTEKDDTFAPILATTRIRSFWLGTNLLTAFLASSVIDLFKDTIQQVVALAVLMPIVASMGGVAGSQTITLVIRNMAQDELFDSNLPWLIRREAAVGMINGVIWALIVAVGASLFFSDYRLGVAIAAALVINLVAGAVTGATLPSLLRKMNIDPAIAGSVVLTTVTDVVGFMSFLGLATLIYT